jgi:hypothetical protein
MVEEGQALWDADDVIVFCWGSSWAAVERRRKRRRRLLSVWRGGKKVCFRVKSDFILTLLRYDCMILVYMRSTNKVTDTCNHLCIRIPAGNDNRYLAQDLPVT